MKSIETQIDEIIEKHNQADLRIQTLGFFQVEVNQLKLTDKNWGRDKTLQLFQYLITTRRQNAMHRDVIIDRLWEGIDLESGSRDFKSCLYGINKALEPERKSRTAYKYIIRQGLSYSLNLEAISIDVDVLENLISLGNQFLDQQPEKASIAYEKALGFYKGIYLPNRIYDDWSSLERENTQTLILGTLITKAELQLEKKPLESIRLAKQILTIDPTWEDAYRIQMKAYLGKGNRPSAIKTYKQCVTVLEKEFGIEPLPITKALFENIRNI